MKLYQKYHEIVADDIDIEAREEFKKLSDGDSENIELWKKFTEISIAATKEQMKLLNVEADYDIGESFYEGLDLPKIGNQPDLIKESESMKVIGKEMIER
jgi:arginyl-tRNA synthetase